MEAVTLTSEKRDFKTNEIIVLGTDNASFPSTRSVFRGQSIAINAYVRVKKI